MSSSKPPVIDVWANAVSTSPDIVTPTYFNTGFPAPSGIPVKFKRGHANWLFNFLTNAVRYACRTGIVEWDAAETDYVAPAVVQSTDGFIYRLFGAATTGLAPQADRTNWRLLIDNRGPLGYGPWGASATDSTIAADTSLTGPGHQRYRNLTVSAGKVLTIQDPGILFVSETLTIENTAKIVFGLKAGGLNGSNGTLNTRGAAGVGWNHGSAPFHNGGPILGGGDGGAGGDASHMTADAGDNTGYSLGGFGGAGGTANTSATGGGGGVIDAYTEGSPNWWPSLIDIFTGGTRGWGVASGGTHGARTATTFGVQAGAGGGGGGGTATNTSAAGGGGGAGGCLGVVIARRVVFALDGCIQAPGGDGGNGFSVGDQGGGGGGGGGGGIVLIYTGKSGPALTAAACCPGGAAGAGNNGGANGVAGDPGTVNEFQVVA